MMLSRPLVPCAVAAILVVFGVLWCPQARAQDLSGCWSGSWEDCKSGHRGPLQATFCKSDEQHYHVVFTGRYFKVIPFRFTTTLDVTGREGGKVLLSGQSRVGLSGSFHYQAEATERDFTANFWSRRYEGVFLLSR